MLCKNCKTKIEEDDLFCPSCGEKVEIQDEKMKPRKILKFIVCILIVVIIGGIGAGTIYLLKSGAPDNRDEAIEVSVANDEDAEDEELTQDNETAEEDETAKLEEEIEGVLADAQELYQTGDTAEAIDVLKKGVQIYDSDQRITGLLEEYENEYIKATLEEAESLEAEGDYNQAIGVIQAALKVVPDEEQLEVKVNDLQNQKPIALTNFKISNSKNFSHNEDSTLMDTVGNQYSAGNLYAFGRNSSMAYADYFLDGEYAVITGIVAVSDKSYQGEDTANFEIYGDDQLLYSTENMSRTTSPIEFSVDISGVEWLKLQRNNIKGSGISMFISDVMLQKN